MDLDPCDPSLNMANILSFTFIFWNDSKYSWYCCPNLSLPHHMELILDWFDDSPMTLSSYSTLWVASFYRIILSVHKMGFLKCVTALFLDFNFCFCCLFNWVFYVCFLHFVCNIFAVAILSLKTNFFLQFINNKKNYLLEFGGLP